MMVPAPLILHVPHSSTAIPSSVRDSILLTDAELKQELLTITDHHSDELFAIRGAVMVRSPVSRLVVDCERFEDDAHEFMAQFGMGVIYTRASSGKTLRKLPSPEEREYLLSSYYRPHHEALTRAVEAAFAEHGSCLIVDCHSFPSRPLPYELTRNVNRPDVCIGTDEYHTPPVLRDAFVAAFEAQGYTVAVNRPFSGALVPSKFHQRNRHIESVMIELNRKLYMDESTGAKLEHFEQVQENVEEIVKNCTSARE